MKRMKTSFVVLLASVALLGGTVFLGGKQVLAVEGEAEVTALSAATEVRTIEEFEKALGDSSVTEISVKESIDFRKNITNIPPRDVTINGNKGEGIVINSKKYSIYGKQGKANAENNVFGIKDANIVGAQVSGRFFTGGSGNGPSSYGWDVYANNVEYEGDRFVHLSEGKLTFGGSNRIETRAENAWVHQLEFEPRTDYNGKAAMKDHGQFSAFYFNGRLVDGKTTGKVTIGDHARINVGISPQSDVNYYYPVFYDKVYQVNLGFNAELNVDAAGVAFQFIPRGDYENVPSLNLARNSRMTLNGRGGGNYATMKLQECGSMVNMDNGSELIIDGNSSKGVVESIYQFASFNLYAPKNLEIANHMANQQVFHGKQTFIKGANLDEIVTWNKTGGAYPFAEVRDRFIGNETFLTYVGGIKGHKETDRSAEILGRNEHTKEDFQMNNYGKIRFIGDGYDN